VSQVVESVVDRQWALGVAVLVLAAVTVRLGVDVPVQLRVASPSRVGRCPG